MVRPFPLASFLLGACIPAHADLLGFAAASGADCMRRVKGTVGVKPECIGAPDQHTIQCPAQNSSARTVHVGFPVAVDFNNTSGDEVLLYWVNDVGAEVIQKTIQPWRSTTQDTFMGHVFRIKNRRGRTLLEHTVGLIPLRDDVHLDASDSGKLYPTCQASEKASVEVGFVNRADSVLKLFFYSPAGNLELVSKIEPHTVYAQQTYKGHEFRAYSADDRPVTSIQIRDVFVPNCMEPVHLDLLVYEYSWRPVFHL